MLFYTEMRSFIMTLVIDTSVDVIDALVQEILKINKLQKNFLESAVSKISANDSRLFKKYLKYCSEQDLTLEYLARCYDLIVQDTFNNQLYFKRHGKYKNSSYAEVESLVYRNNDYMSMYMYGLAITAFLWVNHTQMKHFFNEGLPKNQSGKYLEIGPGHGFHMMEAMRASQYTSFLGVDISPTSVALTHSILSSNYFGDFKGYEIQECDFLTWETTEKFEAVVMGEVLEHVEQPQVFLQKIADVTHKNSHIHITTCINSPAIDHIYLFEDAKQVVDMVEASGLYVKQQLLVPYQSTTLEQSEKDKLPINIALILGKNDD
jgi:2-polyprenyl-3-methyl-5-hydroxy-6-metoxy-1,4-benzoquinol methylase